MGNNNKTINIASQDSFQELGIILQGDTSIRLAIGAEHIGMRKHAITPIHFATVDRIKLNGLNAVKQ